MSSLEQGTGRPATQHVSKVTRPTFADPVVPGGYAWWYIDAQSDDGQSSFSAIAFVGSVFSPHYARASSSAPARPNDHVAINLALYGPNRAWLFVEAAQRSADASILAVGRSFWQHTDDGLLIVIDERTVPWGRRVRGTITLRGCWQTPSQAHVLEASGNHRWYPAMVRARAHVDFHSPDVRWQGDAYHDINCGDEPLAAGFSRWDWLRELRAEGVQVGFRLVGRRDGEIRHLFVAQHADGQSNVSSWGDALDSPLPRTSWGLRRWAGPDMREQERVEDTPFYARARLAYPQRTAAIMHESIDLDRWRRRWVQFLLHFRLRRLGQKSSES